MVENEITDEYDKEFISLMITIEKNSEVLNKYDKLRIKNWCKKLCQITNNVQWKKNRNLHAICILDSILNEHFEEPYNKFPPEGSVPILNKSLVKSKLTKKFFEEMYNIQKIKQQNNEENIKEKNDNINNNDDENDNNNNNEITNNILINKQKDEINNLIKMIKQRDNQIKTLNKEKKQMEEHIEELKQVINKFIQVEKSEE